MSIQDLDKSDQSAEATIEGVSKTDTGVQNKTGPEFHDDPPLHIGIQQPNGPECLTTITGLVVTPEEPLKVLKNIEKQLADNGHIVASPTHGDAVVTPEEPSKVLKNIEKQVADNGHIVASPTHGDAVQSKGVNRKDNRKRLVVQNFEKSDPFAEVTAEGVSKTETLHIRMQQRNGRKCLTTITGLVVTPEERLKLLKNIKKQFSCNGHIVADPTHGDIVQLQGDHRKKLHDYLIELGPFTSENIEVHGS